MFYLRKLGLRRNLVIIFESYIDNRNEKPKIMPDNKQNQTKNLSLPEERKQSQMKKVLVIGRERIENI